MQVRAVHGFALGGGRDAMKPGDVAEFEDQVARSYIAQGLVVAVEPAPAPSPEAAPEPEPSAESGPEPEESTPRRRRGKEE